MWRNLFESAISVKLYKSTIDGSIDLIKVSNVSKIKLDYQLEELYMERIELDKRSAQLSCNQRKLEAMISEMTRWIKRVEFDIKLLNNTTQLKELKKKTEDDKCNVRQQRQRA